MILDKITREAKFIRKKHPEMKWQDAIKLASKRYNKSGKVSGWDIKDKGRDKSRKPSKYNIEVTRKSDGTFKKFTRISGVKKDMELCLRVLPEIEKNMRLIEKSENNIVHLRNTLFVTKDERGKKRIKRLIADENKFISDVKKNISSLKKYL